jgi:hypothetical protein
LYDQGKIIISSADNDSNIQCYPAYYPWVFGVTSGNNKADTHGYIPDSAIEFVGKGSIQRVAWANNKDLIVTGTSYATPHITGIVARYINEEPHLTFEEIKSKLIINSVKSIKPIQVNGAWGSVVKSEIISTNNEEEGKRIFCGEYKFSWMKNIAVYPVSEKEMKQFLAFEHQCTFDTK